MTPHDSDPRPLLLGGPALGLLLIVLAALAAGGMVADPRQRPLAVIRAGVAALAYPLPWAVQAPVQAWAAMRESLATAISRSSTRILRRLTFVTVQLVLREVAFSPFMVWTPARMG